MFAEEMHGVEMARDIRARLADIRAEDVVSDLYCKKTQDSTYKNIMILNFSEKLKIIVKANHNSNPQDDIGNIDWSKVSRIKIISIEVHNG